jgi:hypothetical protein
MLRAVVKTLLVTAIVVVSTVGLYIYHERLGKDYQIQQLQQIVQRLETERRVAKILVTDQKTVDGKTTTTLLFMEYRKDGTSLPPKQFVINGNEAHIDAEVVKFKDEYVQDGDPLRGESIMLFVRIYGADQTPADGFPIDQPGSIPEIYRGIDPQVSQFEQDIWSRFWKLYNDEDARDAIGIRAMNGEGLYGPFDRDHVYTITIRPDGATLNVETLDPIYREAMRHD